MKLLTLNTHSWLEEHQEAKIDQIVAQIIKADYDVIALQEVNQLIENTNVVSDQNYCLGNDNINIKDDNFAYIIVNKLRAQGHNYYFSYAMSHIGYDKYEEGSAILSKQPIKPYSEFVSIDQSPDNYRSRKILFGETQVNRKSIVVASCHFSWWLNNQDGFSYEWMNTKRILEQYNQPLIVMGDFNNPEGTEGYDFVLDNSDLLDTFTKAEVKYGHHTIEKNIAGWENNGGKLRIDFIFASNEFKVQSSKTVFDGLNAPIVSDHFGVEVEITE
ncbi:endonuclease/exonuclease/phosphatase family protein [Macrococcus epidermidis]|uniref:endonuclease/exonuclease/phosphatase family protein n=1 Tax=Macrococcus epidermidis TaxID=1902580 RepID=UPI001EF1A483|nr:endonuclease/exonuclease/phosphatase family protein [Macrococcus epidermidis]MCG7418896.1 endonuclease/exonuclease/phosphatase family protein [Macrococcus epidermidis]